MQQPSNNQLHPFSFERIETARRLVEHRVVKAANALRAKNIPYAVAGDFAIAHYVSRIDEVAVRNSKDVEILIRSTDLASTVAALRAVGLDAGLDGATASRQDSIRLVFGDPGLIDPQGAAQYRVLTLPALVQIKLTAFRDKDRTHLRDLIGFGLVDATWITRLSPILAQRLQQILDNPEG